jgi:hypothetical protein
MSNKKGGMTQDRIDHIKEWLGMNPQYHQTPLDKSEVSALKDLEGMLGEAIPEVPDVDITTFGFFAKDEHVIKLGLHGQGLKSLPDTIGNLTSLKSLYLGGNQLIATPGTMAKLKSLKEIDLS